MLTRIIISCVLLGTLLWTNPPATAKNGKKAAAVAEPSGAVVEPCEKPVRAP